MYDGTGLWGIVVNSIGGQIHHILYIDDSIEIIKGALALSFVSAAKESDHLLSIQQYLLLQNKVEKYDRDCEEALNYRVAEARRAAAEGSGTPHYKSARPATEDCC
jgi:chromosome condensin MukBEF ATPase and DNA-binding subunit MukB